MIYTRCNNLIIVHAATYSGLESGTYKTNDLTNDTSTFQLTREGILLKDNWKFVDKDSWKYKVCVPDKFTQFKFDGVIDVIRISELALHVYGYIFEFSDGILTSFELVDTK